MLRIIILFSFLILCWTTGNIYIGASGFVIFMIIYISYNIIKRQKISYQQIMIYIWIFWLSIISTIWYQQRNQYIYPENGINNIWTVVAISWPDKYVIQIDDQKRVAKTTKQKYHIWDQIKILAKIQMTSQAKQESDHPSDLYNLNINSLLRVDNKSYLLGGEFDYARWMYMKWYAGQLTILGSEYIGRTKWFWWWMYDIRDTLSIYTRANFGNNKTIWLVLGLLIWDRSMIDIDTNKNFINSWLVHILAVSGGNIAVLVSFLTLILFWLPYYLRIWTISMMVIVYGMICGGDSSVVRAVIMASIAIIGLFSGRDANIWRTLTITYILMLIGNPYILAYDMWFGLSFGAIVGLLLFDIRKYLVSKWLYPVRERIMPSIGANLWVLPVIILASAKINPLWILANFVVLPLLPIILLWSVLVLGLYGLGISNIYMINKLIIYIMDGLSWWIFGVSDWVSSHGIYLHFEVLWVRYALVWFCIIWWIVIYEYLQKKKIEEIDK